MNESDEFYTWLDRIFDGLPSNDNKVLLENFNDKIGHELFHRGTIGGQSLHHGTNDNG